MVLGGGLLYVDGSGLHAELPRLRSAGRAAVVLRSDGAMVGAAFEAVPLAPCPLQTARDGADYAATWAARHLRGRFAMRVDCAATVRCAKRQESDAVPAKPRAHIWRPV